MTKKNVKVMPEKAIGDEDVQPYKFAVCSKPTESVKCGRTAPSYTYGLDLFKKLLDLAPDQSIKINLTELPKEVAGTPEWSNGERWKNIRQILRRFLEKAGLWPDVRINHSWHDLSRRIVYVWFERGLKDAGMAGRLNGWHPMGCECPICVRKAGERHPWLPRKEDKKDEHA